MARSWTTSQTAAMSLRGKTLLVSAAAGSGKTSVLTERIIRSLLDPEHPADLSRMLIVTFTRAAAAELKGRIATALSDALSEHPENRHLSRQILLLGSAQISTIDSFFQKAVRANFEQLGLPASFRPADENELLPVSLEVLEGLIEDYYEAYTKEDPGDGLFARLKNNKFAEIIDHLISDRSDGRLNTILPEFIKSYSSDPEGVKLLKRFADALYDGIDQDYLDTSYGGVIKTYLSELFLGYLSSLHEFAALFAPDPDLSHTLSGILGADIAYCEAVLASLHEGNYERLRTVVYSFVPGRFPTIKDKPYSVECYQVFRNKLKDDLKKRIQPMLAPPAEAIKEEMSSTADLVEMLYRFYSDYEMRFLAEKQARGVLEYNDVRGMLYKLLCDENGDPTPFADSLAAQYDAVYIDEYQDVDFIQDRIFALIGRDHRFMVGDIKQSVYGFRGSEPAIFAGYRKAMPLYTDPDAGMAEGNCVFMSENFRCDRPVINFANRVCSFLFSACEESVGYLPQDDLVCSKPDPESYPKGHPVPVRFTVFDAPPRGGNASEEDEDAPAREEPVWVAAEIASLLRTGTLDNGARITPSDIAILARTHKQGEAYAAELKKLNIPVAASASSEFLFDPHLSHLLNLLRAIDNPYRDLPLSEFLLSPLGRFTLEELTAIRETANAEHSLFAAMEQAAVAASPLGQKCRTMLAFLEKQRESAAVQPADRFLRLLYLEDALRPYAEHPTYLFLYEQARIYQRTAFCGLYGFLSHITKLMEGGKVSAGGFCKAESAVTVMTIHHSKGLEFPVVFVVSMGAAFSKKETQKGLLCHRRVGCAAKLYNRESGAMEDTALRAAVKLQIETDQVDESIRTLYVALTRARERLYVTGTLRGKLETAQATASLVKRGNRAAILGASSPLAWFLATVGTESTEELTATYLPFGSVEPGIPLEEAPMPESAPEKETDATALRYAALIRRRSEFVYPTAYASTLPAKVAASKIASDLLDRLEDTENEDAALETQIDLMRAAMPNFETLLAESALPTAAEIGTATHSFLQFCDLSALTAERLDAECDRLISLGFLTPENAKIINRRQLESFCKSDLLSRIKAAKSVRREQQFSMLFPAARLTQDPKTAAALKDATVFVQGSIDLLLESADGKLILVDYKTDRIPKEIAEDPIALEDKMFTSHGEQLAAYARAVSELFGRLPDEVLIYSIPLGKCIAIPQKKILGKI